MARGLESLVSHVQIPTVSGLPPVKMNLLIIKLSLGKSKDVHLIINIGQRLEDVYRELIFKPLAVTLITSSDQSLDQSL